jgi:hypothetical protein
MSTKVRQGVSLVVSLYTCDKEASGTIHCKPVEARCATFTGGGIQTPLRIKNAARAAYGTLLGTPLGYAILFHPTAETFVPESTTLYRLKKVINIYEQKTYEITLYQLYQLNRFFPS